MDFIKDIYNKSIQKFGYVVKKDNGMDTVVILGVSGVEKIGNYPFESRIYQINQKMQAIYNQEMLSDDDKKALVELMEEMNKFCEPQDYQVLATRYEQEAFVKGLTENESKQLDEQLQMIMDCRNLYPKFGNRYNKEINLWHL